jgi:hypothetical protein
MTKLNTLLKTIFISIHELPLPEVKFCMTISSNYPLGFKFEIPLRKAKEVMKLPSRRIILSTIWNKMGPRHWKSPRKSLPALRLQLNRSSYGKKNLGHINLIQIAVKKCLAMRPEVLYDSPGDQ